jgi:hypothetical protein
MSYSVPSLDSVMPGIKISLKNDQAEVYSLKYCHDSLSHSLSPSLSSSSSHLNHLSLSQTVQMNDTYFHEGILTFSHVFTSEECQYLREVINNEKNLSFWNTQGRENEKARLFRDADTIEVEQFHLAEILWSRIKHLLGLLPIEISEDDIDNPLYERELPGRWIPVGFNQNMLFALYPPGGHFAPHTDGREIHHFNRRSFYSVVIYLNSIPLCYGGGTRFYRREVLDNLRQASTGQWTCPVELYPKFVTTEIEAIEGSVLLFDQRLVHEGVALAPSLSHPPSPLIPPPELYKKYIIRSDIMYERDPPVVFSQHDDEAYRLFREAESLGEQGRVEESIPLFRKACKLSPELAAMMGH